MPPTEAAAAPPLERRPLRDLLGEMHYRLRTEADTPGRNAAAIALGTFIGCVPLYGAHLLLCVVLARALRLNRVVTYLAAHVNNPFTAPWILAASLGIGHRVLRGDWPPPSLSALARVGALGLGRDILFGSLVLGAGLGALFGLAALAIGRRTRHLTPWNRRVDEVSRAYLGAGPFHWEFVRGKLRHDPVYRAIDPLLQDLAGGALLDLGCGRGIALALAAGRREGSPTPSLVGVERREAVGRVAASALGPRARIVAADLTAYEPAAADLILLVDVLHYLDAPDQERLLDRACDALRPGGRLLLREADAGGGLRFRITAAGERVASLARRAWRQRFHFRPADDWETLLRARGLATSRVPLHGGGLLANVLIEGRRPGEGAAGPPQWLAVGRPSTSE
jgi:uncharacterized protein (DUF2062 family)